MKWIVLACVVAGLVGVGLSERVSGPCPDRCALGGVRA
jgi:hypothetical protein